jgi:hypothetical protein
MVLLDSGGSDETTESLVHVDVVGGIDAAAMTM